jgi:anti-anti-sigma factor
MEIIPQEFKHCDLLTINGKVDSFTAPELIKTIEELQNNGKYRIVLNMERLEYMSSAGFRALLIGQRNSKRYNRGELVLANVPQKIMDALELTGFTPLFKIFTDVTSAVGYF